jgi:hypothetical protein
VKLWKVAIIVAIVIVLAPIGRASPERALENPIWLSEVEDAPLMYLSYSSELEEFLAAYTEYDAYAKGHGALIVRGKDEETILTGIMTKEQDEVALGLAVHRLSNAEITWLLDLGASYQVGAASLRVGVHDVPFTKWEDIKDEWHFSAGASLALSKSIAVGIDVRFLEEPVYKGHVLFNIRPDLNAQIYAIYQQPDWDAVGIDAWFYRGGLLFHVGYKMDWDKESYFRVGIGFHL